MGAVQRAAKLKQIRDKAAAADGRQLSDAEWADLAGLPSQKALSSMLAAGQAASRRLIDANMGLLYQFTYKYCGQVCPALLCLISASSKSSVCPQIGRGLLEERL